MKAYIKPGIEVVAIASSMPIAGKTCSGDSSADYDHIQSYEDGKDGIGIQCINHVWQNGVS